MKSVVVYCSIILFYFFISSTGYLGLSFGIENIFSAIILRLPVTILLIIVCTYGGDKLRRKRGWRRLEWVDLFHVATLSLITVSLGYLFYRGVSWSIKINLPLYWILSLSFVTALSEELYFRSFLLSSLISIGWKNWTAVLFSSILFTILHSWQGRNAVLFAMFSAVLYACFFLMRYRIITVILAHFIHNSVALFLAMRE